MRISGSRIFHYTLPLKAEWRDAHGGFAQRNGTLIRFEADNGLSGWGDCAPLREDGSAVALERWHVELVGLKWSDVQATLRHAELPPAARCAAETALADLAAQQAELPLARWLNPAAEMDVRCNAALGVLCQDSIKHALDAVREGFTVLKLKVGLADVDADLTRLHALAAALPAGIMLRLDANRAWNDADARHFLAGLEGLPVDLVEEPLANPDLVRLADLQQQTLIPLALDESLALLGLGQHQMVAAVILKPMLLGGLDASLAWAGRAHNLGMKCIATSSVDSAVGVLAAAHLAAALGTKLHHGLDTARWLVSDVGRSPNIMAGVMRLGSLPGLNFEADWKALGE